MEKTLVRVYAAGKVRFSIVTTPSGGFQSFIVNQRETACTRECKTWSASFAEAKAHHFMPLETA